VIKLTKFRFKIIVLGDANSGKTSFLNKYIYGNMGQTRPNIFIGTEFYSKDLTIDNFNVSLIFFDPGGQSISILRNLYYKDASGVILTFDLTNRKTFEKLPEIFDHVRLNVGQIPFLLIGTKADLIDKREIDFAEANKFATENGIIYFETSAFTGMGINESIGYLIRLMIGYSTKQFEKGSIYLDFEGGKAILSISSIENSKIEVRLSTPHGLSDLKSIREIEPNKLKEINDKITEFTNLFNAYVRAKRSGSDQIEMQNHEKKPMTELIKLGKSIHDFVIPNEIKNQVDSIRIPIELVIDEKFLGIYWELMNDGKEFYCLKSIGRKIDSKKFFLPDMDISTKKSINFLVIGNPRDKDPDYSLPAASKEVEKIVKLLKQFKNVKVTLLHGKSATKSNVLKELRKGIYNFIHFAGHASFNIETIEESSLLLADDLLYAKEIMEILRDSPPILAFINACESSKTIIPDGEISFESNIYGLASAFFSVGTFYIGALWPIHDDSAIEIAREFYKRLLNGQSIGSALQSAKLYVREKYGYTEISWLTYILYGDPTLTLKTF